MKKLLIVLLFSVGSLSAQTAEAIKDLSGAAMSLAGDMSGGGDACIDGCFSIFNFVDFFFVFNELFLLENRDFIYRKQDDNVGLVKSFQLEGSFGLADQGSTVVLPSIRYYGGRYGTSFRMYRLMDRRLGDDDTYSTYDWQLLFNFLVQQDVRLSFGTGMAFEAHSGNAFHEMSLSGEIFPEDRIRVRPEIRIAPDYRADRMMRVEFNSSVGYRISQESSPVEIYGTIYGRYARLYSELDTWTTGAGLAILF
ncbi:hypothetical protein N8482_02145 [Chitinophagales bacterium]|nr:hypothetical protein [Chitinophagales bacterium]